MKETPNCLPLAFTCICLATFINKKDLYLQNAEQTAQGVTGQITKGQEALAAAGNNARQGQGLIGQGASRIQQAGNNANNQFKLF